MITIKEIIRFEALSGKGFSASHLLDDTDCLALLYATDKEFYGKMTLEDYSGYEKRIAEQFKYVSEQIKLINQYHAQGQDIPIDSDEEEVGSSASTTDLVRDLIAFGVVSAEYAMNEMELWELPIYAKGLFNRKKYEAENDRAWVWHLLTPHMSKPITPTELHPFAWEESERAREEERNIRRIEEAHTDEWLQEFFKNS